MANLLSKQFAVKAAISIVLLITFVYTSKACFLYQIRYKNFDQFMHVQMLTNILRKWYPAPSMPPSVLATTPYWYSVPTQDIPFDKLVVTKPYYIEFFYHTSFIFYLLVPLALVFGPAMALAIASVAVAFAMVLIPMWYLRDHNVHWTIVILFGLAVVLHPHTLGVLLGEFYPVRLIIPLLLMMLILIDREPERIGPVLLFAFLVTMCREEAGFYCALVIGAYITLTRRWNWRWAAVVAFLTVLSLMLIYLTRSDPTIPLATKGVLSQVLDLQSVKSNILKPDRLYFLAVNLIGFGAMAFFDWRKLLVALLLMVPNLIVTLGGAEATGFATHYHSFYIPAMIWASMSGVVKLMAQFKFERVAFVTASVLLLVPISYQLTAETFGIRPQWLIAPSSLSTYKNVLSSEKHIVSYIEGLRREIRKDEIVVTGAPVIPLAEFVEDVFFAPVNLNKADVVIMWDSPTGPSIDRGGAAWMEPEKVNQRILQIMQAHNFDIANPKTIGPVLVFRKRQTPAASLPLRSPS